MNRIVLALVALLLAACAVRSPAPVVDRTPGQPPKPVEAPAEPPKPVEKPIPTYAVKRGDTLVGIALQFGLDYRELAAWNNITNPNVLSVGQVLVVAAPAGARPLGSNTTSPLGATPLVGAGPPIEARPLANTPNAKVEPRGEKVPYTDRAIAQLNAVPGGAPPSEGPTTTVQPSGLSSRTHPPNCWANQASCSGVDVRAGEDACGTRHRETVSGRQQTGHLDERSDPV